MSGRCAWLVALLLVASSRLAAQEPASFVVRQSASPCLNIRPRADAEAPPFACLTPGTAVSALASAP